MGTVGSLYGVRLRLVCSPGGFRLRSFRLQPYANSTVCRLLFVQGSSLDTSTHGFYSGAEDLGGFFSRHPPSGWCCGCILLSVRLHPVGSVGARRRRWKGHSWIFIQHRKMLWLGQTPERSQMRMIVRNPA